MRPTAGPAFNYEARTTFITKVNGIDAWFLPMSTLGCAWLLRRGWRGPAATIHTSASALVTGAAPARRSYLCDTLTTIRRSTPWRLADGQRMVRHKHRCGDVSDGQSRGRERHVEIVPADAQPPVTWTTVWMTSGTFRQVML